MTKNRIREDAFKMSGSMGTDAIDYAWPQIEDFAKQKSIAFAEWIPQNAVIAEDGYHYLWIKDLSEISSEELYSLYQQSKNKQP